jgi:hypothetical protein
MSFTTYDFDESLKGESIDRSAVKRAVAAWGYSPEGYGSWSGGFLLEMKDGRYAYITGWCDTTGWGCQDGTSIAYFDSEPPLESLKRDESSSYHDEPVGEWETTLPDLQKYIETGEGKWN